MTALLEAPELVIVEQRQPDVPIICTRGHGPNDELSSVPCPRKAHWEALCMVCCHVFRRCEEHYAEDAESAGLSDYWEVDAGQCHLCATCEAPVFIDQYVRIGA